MTARVPSNQIEAIVGINRKQFVHVARAVTTEQTVYILHSAHCLSQFGDLRDCPFSKALDAGIDRDYWQGYEDQPIIAGIAKTGELVPDQILTTDGELP